MNSLFQTRIQTTGNEKYYDPRTFSRFIAEALQGTRTTKDNKRNMYFNVPCAFDIETSSFMEDGEKRGCMYLWAFGLNGLVLYGRTWPEFMQLCQQLSDILGLSDTKRMICYVHNLAYEFQWIRKRFSWLNVFSLRERKPIYALCSLGIEFRCSYLLSGYALKDIGKQLQVYKTEKAVGSLDYSLVRHSQTPITAEELYYQVQDVKTVMAYIMECIEKEGNNITYIPLTKTGYVRRYCRDKCLYQGKHHRQNRSYKNVIKSLTLTPEVYVMLKRAFQGGFTHASCFASGKVYEDVTSYDFTSSYPAVMVAEKFPMSAPEEVEITNEDELQHNINLYCCLFDVEISGLKPKIFIDHPLSRWKCYRCQNVIEDNGRVVSADYLLTTLTDIDYKILSEFYTWKALRVGRFFRFRRGYLPTSFVKAVLKLYEDKTTLKGVKDKKAEYQHKKEMLNSCYGMSVTDIVREIIGYEDAAEWTTTAPDLVETIAKYNAGRRRFLYYPWGVWVTAYARANLFSGIMAFGSDYLYSDTDSIKAIHAERHEDYINRYNEAMIRKLRAACRHHKIPESAIMPETVEGIKKPLGVWDLEERYQKFKTLGAKRYMVELDGAIEITVAGVGKQGGEWLQNTYGAAAFDAFSDGLEFPPEATGKNTHIYIDDELQGLVTDYTGKTAAYHELSAVYMEGAAYSLSIGKLYAEYLRGFYYE